jgi:uncharacterized protein YecE (DUF72 family)
LEAVFAGDARLRIGTSSWSSKDWVGPFYPTGTRPERFIEHYSSVYDTVEVDSTFYRPPSNTQIRAWRSRTPDGFLFSLKTPRIITHDKVLVDAVDDMRRFVDTVSGLRERLGPILLQFPYFNRRGFPAPEQFFDRLERFLDVLPEHARYVVEVRNRAWVGRRLQQLCGERRVAVAWVEQAWMPTARQWPELTGGPSTDFGYVRWLGDHKAIEKLTNRWDRLVLDRSAVLDAWTDVMLGLRSDSRYVFGYFNNHFAGHAPASVEQFRRRMEERYPQSSSPNESHSR